jgi:hypothetical protein
MNTTQDNNRSRQGRIPATLQAVFLASNRGREVNKPPPAKVASKIYFSNWLFQRHTGSKEKRGVLFGGSKKDKKSKKSNHQPQKKIIQESVAQTQKVKVCTHGQREMRSRLSICQHFYFAHTPPISFSSLYSPLSQPCHLRSTWTP